MNIRASPGFAVFLFLIRGVWSVARGAWGVEWGVLSERELASPFVSGVFWCGREKKNAPTQLSHNLFGAVIMAVVSGSEFESLLSMLER